MFYWAFGNAFLTESGMSNSPAWQSSGQMTEIIFIFMMPLFFRRFGVKKMLLLGIAAWIARFACFALGVWDFGNTMMNAAIPAGYHQIDGQAWPSAVLWRSTIRPATLPTRASRGCAR